MPRITLKESSCLIVYSVALMLIACSQLRRYTASDLITAANTGNIELLRKALNAGVSVDSTDESGSTALHRAMFTAFTQDLEQQKTECARLLLAAGSKVDPKNSLGQTPLYLACFSHNISGVRLLVSHKATIDPGLIPFIFEKFIQYSDEPGQPYIDVIRLLVVNGAPINGDKEVLTTVIDSTSISRRRQWRHEMLLYFLDHGADPNGGDDSKRIRPPLNEFFQMDGERQPRTSLEDVKLLLDRGASVRRKDYEGLTALDTIRRYKVKVAPEVLNALEAGE